MADVVYEFEDYVATITLNRPDRLNAISGEMLEQLSSWLLECDANRDVRAILLTGAGRGFCAGLDLKDAAASSTGIASDAQSVTLGGGRRERGARSEVPG